MRDVYGIGDFRYEYVEGWGTLPAGVTACTISCGKFVGRENVTSTPCTAKCSVLRKTSALLLQAYSDAL